MRGAPAGAHLRPHLTHGDGSASPHFFQHPSSVSALRADPPSPTRGEGIADAGLTPSGPPP
ncbi:MAG: hypothetical protein EOS04_17360 [Mesorhizobium sp.]|nr:MAG: hypothetical protein EOR98_29135 [Mesorhizobium sp.]RWN78372.1 MAG: hypothetical protein EOS01_16250 [Mesorhizobium sp.]RWN80976.1 MAG: hypothetical protein EOS02_03620 [Mesorhizobium sp.]RWN86675.1 MAG: hypothetical protein EOS04_17360 [Mesorhizobium sp.]RWO16310.1 MAG: hypothetical protein EOS15_04755 [Mesorhizobium sp.]